MFFKRNRPGPRMVRERREHVYQVEGSQNLQSDDSESLERRLADTSGKVLSPECSRRSLGFLTRRNPPPMVIGLTFRAARNVGIILGAQII